MLATAAAVGMGTLLMGGQVAGAAVCANETYTWNDFDAGLDENWKLLPGNATYDSGIVVPAPGAGQTLKVVSSAYKSFDRYAAGSSPSRADVNQQNESFAIRVGGIQIGGLSADLPDTVAEGATDDWFSGVLSGSFGGSGTILTGGSLVFRHASLYGFNESFNSLHPKMVSIVLERCTAAVTTTTAAPTTTAAVTTTTAAVTTTTAAVTTTTAAVTTTTAAVTTTTTRASTTTTVAATTTTVASGGPTTTAAPTTTTITTAATTTSVASGGPTTTAVPSMPVTGDRTVVPLVMGAVAAGTGLVLLLVRRRSI
jgi:hypothetical protein